MKKHYGIIASLAALLLAASGPASEAQPSGTKREIIPLEGSETPPPPQTPARTVTRSARVPRAARPARPGMPACAAQPDSTVKREYINLGRGEGRGNGSWQDVGGRAWGAVSSVAKGGSGYWSRGGSEKKVRYFDMSGHWMGVGLGYSGLVSSLGRLRLPAEADYMSQKAGSINVNINLFNTGIISTRHFALVTGIGMELNNFKFEKNVSLTRDPTGYIIPDESYAAQGIRLKKSKLSTNYFVVPLLAEFRFPVDGRGRPFYFYGGVTGGWCFNAHTKVKYFVDGDRKKDKRHSHLNIRNFKYGYTVGIGYNRFGLYASYYPESLFRAGKGPEVRQVNIGLSLNFGKNVY